MLGPTAKEKTKARVEATRKTPTPGEEEGSRFRATVRRMLNEEERRDCQIQFQRHDIMILLIRWTKKWALGCVNFLPFSP